MFHGLFSIRPSVAISILALTSLVTACGPQAPAFTETQQIIPVSTGGPSASGSNGDANVKTAQDANDSAKSADANTNSADSSNPKSTPIPSSIDADIKIAAADVFACKGDAVSLKAGQSVNLVWTWSMQEIVDFNLAKVTSGAMNSLGAIDRSKLSSGYLIYKAPDSISANGDVAVSATSINLDTPAASCKIRLIADTEIGTSDDGKTQGVKGNVYQLVAGQPKLPDFSKMAPVDQIIVSNIDVPNHAWSTGFPGVRNLYEWFGIQLQGNLYVSKNSQCSFRIDADDGANLYIDGIKVVDNDGVHAVRSAYGDVNLTAGKHAVRVDYYQGPRYYIALQVLWKCDGQTKYQIVPPEAYREPLQ